MLHLQCPIHKRKYKNTDYILDDEIILNCIKEANVLNFSGLIGFHYYNEPMLEIKRIFKIMDRAKNSRFLLWTNGTLLDKKVENNVFLNRFYGVIITKYSVLDPEFLENIKLAYPNVKLNEDEMDNRIQIYEKQVNYKLSCKRPYLELPIDYHGNIHLCCIDWNNTYTIGNIFYKPFKQIIMSERYQNILNSASEHLLGKNSPNLCSKCFKHLVRYTKSNYIGNSEI